MSHAPRRRRQGRQYNADDGEDAIGCAANGVEVQQHDREQMRRAVDIILDQDLKPEAKMPEDADHHQDQRQRYAGIRGPAQHRGMIAERQADQRHEKEADEQDVAERGQPLLQPMLRPMSRRAKAADLAQMRPIAQQSAPAMI